MSNNVANDRERGRDGLGGNGGGYIGISPNQTIAWLGAKT